jgi:hypothetical protein
MAEMEYEGYRIVANAGPAPDDHAGKWVFEAATIYDAAGNRVELAAPVSTEPQYFDSEEAAAKVCLSQAKALIVAGDVG